ncbi:WXG100 family type VII secretion target [Actinophytocola sp.]|uniref:WXG100 family type VII secretion target n=1 Tax=Actinophytocola sp. TaxID=1872138 RepID=UPI003D6B38D7
MPDAQWGTPEDMQNAAVAANNSAANIRSAISRIEGQVATMMATWQGRAPVAFDAKHLEWRRQVDALVAELERVGAAAGTSGTAYTTSDDDTTSAMNSAVLSGLNFRQ